MFASRQQIDVFGHEKQTERECLLFGINSPLVPIFRKAILAFKEAGKQDLLMRRWTGADINENWSVEKTILTSGQVRTFVCLIFLGVKQ